MVADSRNERRHTSTLESSMMQFDTKLNALGQGMDASKGKIDARMKAVNESINNLTHEVSSLKADMANMAKLRSLEWALDHTDIGCFEYKYKPAEISVSYESPKFVKDVLISFRTGHGTFLDENYYYSTRSYVGTQNATDAEKAAFREKLSTQIHMLTGQKSRLQKKEDGRYVLYYS